MVSKHAKQTNVKQQENTVEVTETWLWQIYANIVVSTDSKTSNNVSFI